MDSLVQCHYCKQSPTNPLELQCHHAYCEACLAKNIQNDKVTCPICGVEHMTPISSLSSAKPDKLVPFLIGLRSREPYSVITDQSPPTIQAQCAQCKQATELRTCLHCDKALCADCRTKHHLSQKKEVDESLRKSMTTVNDLINLGQALNISRNTRIETYKVMKTKVSTHSQDLIHSIQEEEQRYQKQIDEHIQSETSKIPITEQEVQHLQKHKAAISQVTDTYEHENNQMILTKMHKDYMNMTPVWTAKIESEAGRLNPKREEV
ncbi:unnamed protein product [Rotaria sordida]|uniref:RING-type domain-containing protein n=1 Tax=Rotaria sordida TaxID=392033 RepID=A0A814KPR1_9BILA|nr:unnamed protein product [Rotaria sordida]